MAAPGPVHGALLQQVPRRVPLSDISAGVEVVGSVVGGEMSLPLTVILTGHRHRSLQGYTTALGDSPSCAKAIDAMQSQAQGIMMMASF